MVMLAKNTRLRFTMNNNVVDAPEEWEDMSVNASFEDGDMQATLNADSFTFSNNEAKIIRDWISSGNIFRGLPFKIDAYNVNQSLLAYDGFINCANDVQLHEDTTVEANIQIGEGLNTLNDRLRGLTLEYLYNTNVITDSDFTTVDYVVEKNLNIQEIIANLILGYILVTQLRNQIQSTAKAISNAFAHATGGISGGIAATVFAIAAAAIELIYTAFLVVAIINIGTKIFNMLIPIVRKHRTLKLRNALTKISQHLGYNFISNIDLLDTLHYLPSNTQTDDVNILSGIIDIARGTSTGIPSAGDYGWTSFEFFDICMKMFQAKIQVKNGDLIFLSENDPYWQSTSTYVLPDILKPVKRFNTNELKFSKLLQFRTDEIADEWTFINYRGTNYHIITDDPSIPNDGAKYIEDHETIAFNVALGNRKDELNALENSLKDLAKVVDDTINFFGGSSNLSQQVKNRVGLLKQGTNNHTVPKIIYLNDSGRLPVNHRDLFSAKTLYDRFINYRSFVLNNFGNQKAIFEIENTPFGFEDFLKTIENSNFTDSIGGFGKFRDMEWIMAGDYANITIEKKEVYCTSLVETYIETE